MKPCKICGEPFLPTDENKTLCSPACRKENVRRKSAVGRAKRKAVETPAETAQARAQAIAGAHRCITCGEPCRRYECAACFRLTKWRVAAGIIGALYAMREKVAI